nr:60S acidic ribosomal protein P2 [Loxodonta africana]
MWSKWNTHAPLVRVSPPVGSSPGNAFSSAKDIKKILDGVGIEVDEDLLSKVISELNGENIIAQDMGNLVRVPAGGAVADSAALGSAAPATGWILATTEETRKRSQQGGIKPWDLACLIKSLLLENKAFLRKKQTKQKTLKPQSK